MWEIRWFMYKSGYKIQEVLILRIGRYMKFAMCLVEEALGTPFIFFSLRHIAPKIM